MPGAPRQLPAVVARLGAEVTVVEPEQRLPVDLAEDDELGEHTVESPGTGSSLTMAGRTIPASPELHCSTERGLTRWT